MASMHCSALSLLCLALCCSSALAARSIKQVSDGGPTSAATPSRSLAPGPAPGPAPAVAPTGSEGGPNSCAVQSQVPQKSGTANGEFVGTACVISTPNLSADECNSQAKSSGRTYIPVGSGATLACLYPSSAACPSSVQMCSGDTLSGLSSSLSNHDFDSAIIANTKSPPLYSTSSLSNFFNSGSDDSSSGTGNASSPPGPSGK